MPRSPITPEMNVTPLVDVVLVLLIIFMVVTPQLEAGAQVNLPSILNADAQGKGKLDPITVSLTARGETYLERDALASDVLETQLDALHKQSPARLLVLKADREVRYDDVRKLFARCRAIGFPGVSLQVGERHEENKNSNTKRGG